MQSASLGDNNIRLNDIYIHILTLELKNWKRKLEEQLFPELNLSGILIEKKS